MNYECPPPKKKLDCIENRFLNADNQRDLNSAHPYLAEKIAID